MIVAPHLSDKGQVGYANDSIHLSHSCRISLAGTCVRSLEAIARRVIFQRIALKIASHTCGGVFESEGDVTDVSLGVVRINFHLF